MYVKGDGEMVTISVTRATGPLSSGPVEGLDGVIDALHALELEALDHCGSGCRIRWERASYCSPSSWAVRVVTRQGRSRWGARLDAMSADGAGSFGPLHLHDVNVIERRSLLLVEAVAS